MFRVIFSTENKCLQLVFTVTVIMNISVGQRNICYVLSEIFHVYHHTVREWDRSGNW